MANGPEIYFIGGAPCGGKSTAARAICARHGFRAFELDKNLERYTHLGMLATRCCARLQSPRRRISTRCRPASNASRSWRFIASSFLMPCGSCARWGRARPFWPKARAFCLS